MTALLCPLCSQSRFDTLEALRGRLVRAATQNIVCPICGDYLLGLDKFTIHLFGHSLPPSEPPPCLLDVNPPSEPPPPSTVNMDDLSFLTSWESCWKQKHEFSKQSSSSFGEKQIKQDEPACDIVVEIKPETPRLYLHSSTTNTTLDHKHLTHLNGFSTPVLNTICSTSPTFENSSSGQHPRFCQSLPTTELPTTENLTFQNYQTVCINPSMNLLDQQNIEKVIRHEFCTKEDIRHDSGLRLESSLDKTPMSRFDEPRLQDSPSEDSPPAIPLDREATFLLTPSPKCEDENSLEGLDIGSNGEVKELSQCMAGLLRLEGVSMSMPAEVGHIAVKVNPNSPKNEPHETLTLVEHKTQDELRKITEFLQLHTDFSRHEGLLRGLRKQVEERPETVMVLPQENEPRKYKSFPKQSHGSSQEIAQVLQGLMQPSPGEQYMPQNTAKIKKQGSPQTTQGYQEKSPEMPTSIEQDPVIPSSKEQLKFVAELLQKKRQLDEQQKSEEPLRLEKDAQDAFVCRECGKSFRMRGSLVVHARVAHAGKGMEAHPEHRNFHCTLCSKSFKKEQHLSQHLKTHDGKQWQCETCAKFFTTKYFLKKHQRLHTGEMPYCCETCGKTFTFQQSYHKHLLYHSADKPHECRECGRTFKELSTLHNHQRIHSGEKPFACETCGKCFRQRVSYIVHQRIHTGVLPYQCTACSKKFRYKVSQRSHKCTAQPPGVVVRQPGDFIQRLLEQRRFLQCQE